MKSIAAFVHEKFNLSERASAWTQLGVTSVGVITVIVFSDFFVSFPTYFTFISVHLPSCRVFKNNYATSLAILVLI